MTITTSLKDELERARQTARGLSDTHAKDELHRYLDQIEKRLRMRRER